MLGKCNEVLCICVGEKSVESLATTKMLTLLRATKYNLRVLRATLKTLALIKRIMVF